MIALLAATLLAAPRAEPAYPSQTIDLLESGQGVLAPSRATFDAKRNCYYLIGGVWDGQVMRLDATTGELTELLRKPGGFTDILYDPTVDRIFASSSYINLFVLDHKRKYRTVPELARFPRSLILFLCEGSCAPWRRQRAIVPRKPPSGGGSVQLYHSPAPGPRRHRGAPPR